MLWLKPYVAKIQGHLKAGTEERLTYAALECRLAIERVCYERLRVSYEYISERDLRPRWTPKQVIDFLVAEANESAATEFTLSISAKPVEAHDGELTVADFEGVDYIPVGTQIGFRPKLMGSLWQALSSFLHVRMPRSKDDDLTTYCDRTALTSKLQEALTELERLSVGTLVSDGMGETVSFECRCGLTNKRRASLLTSDKILSCSNPNCKERYRVHIAGAEFEFERLTIEIRCRYCKSLAYFGQQEVIGIGLNGTATYDCDKCGGSNRLAWKLMQANAETGSAGEAPKANP